LTRLLIVVRALGLWEWAARTERVDRLTVPPASSVFAELDDIVTSDGFMMHVERTAFEIVMAFGFGLVGGILLGVVFWKSRAVSEALEPFLVTLYAMPTLVFYPILLAMTGLNAGPIIVITVVFAIVPVAMNTMNALRSRPSCSISRRRSACRAGSACSRSSCRQPRPSPCPASSSDSSTPSSAPSPWSSSWPTAGSGT